MGKIITIYGAPGTGKTTLAANIAGILAEQENVVCIVNADINCGSIQTFFGESVGLSESVFRALQDNTEQYNRYFVQIEKKPNIYLLSAPNETYSVQTTQMPKEQIFPLMRKVSSIFDYVIVDATSDLLNGITLTGIAFSDFLLWCHKSTINCCLFQKSHTAVLSQLAQNNTFNIINEHDIGCTIQDFLRSSEMSPDIILPDVADAAFLENQGRLIVDNRGKAQERYRNNILKIIDEIKR